MTCKTCKKCDLIQDDLLCGNWEAASHVLIGEGNVLVCGCKDHITELLVRVREKTEKLDDRDHRILLTGYLHGLSMEVRLKCFGPEADKIANAIDRMVQAQLQQLPEVTHEMATSFLRNFETKHE